MIADKQYILSIIIPVYNNADFIDETLKSVYACITEETEVIIINDGSTDNTEEKIQQFLLCHGEQQTRFISQENQGVSASRNTGLKYARGNYIAFVDSDDVISPDYYAVLLPLARRNKYDIIEFNLTRDYKKLYHSEHEHHADPYTEVETVVTNDNKNTLMPVFKASQWHLVTKLFRRELVGDDKFEIARRYEDMMFTPFLYLKSIHNVKVNRTLYFYRKNKKSITENLQESDAEHIFYAMMKMCSYVQKDEKIKTLATPMIINCFLEGRKIIRKKRGFYDYNDNMLADFSLALHHCDKNVIPNRIFYKMKCPKLDSFISIARYKVIRLLKSRLFSGKK